jgi:uncharacterized membrane protein
MRLRILFALMISFVLTSLTAIPTSAGPPLSSTDPVVRAVMFWMDGCPHCREVINNVLTSLKLKHRNQLDILMIEVKTEQDFERLSRVAAAFGVSKDRVGVPFLIVGNQVLIGSGQIPAEFPGLVEKLLEAGGIDYPNEPELTSVLSAGVPFPDLCSPGVPCSEASVQGDSASPAALPGGQPGSSGFELAVAVLVGMGVALVYTGLAAAGNFRRRSAYLGPQRLEYVIPLLAAIGLVVAGYLAYVETQAVPAICGPIGDCNAVQSSPYARLFGVLPIGLLGVAGYLAILGVWFWGRLRPDRIAAYAPVMLFGMALVGVLFSLYLTYLEPFVIKAVCMWCLSSAVIITLLMLLSLGPALHAIQPNRNKRTATPLKRRKR